MKTTSIKLLIVCLLITNVTGTYNIVCAQNELTRKERKEAEKAMLTANFYAQDTILNLREFVLEADYLQGRRGEMVSVRSNINFIKVQGTKGTLQTGSTDNGFNRRFNDNGVGGITTEGNISNYKVKRNTKSLTHNVTFDLISSLGAFNINMNIMADNTANATITSSRSMLLTWKGTLVALFNSKIFRGQDTY